MAFGRSHRALDNSTLKVGGRGSSLVVLASENDRTPIHGGVRIGLDREAADGPSSDTGHAIGLRRTIPLTADRVPPGAKMATTVIGIRSTGTERPIGTASITKQSDTGQFSADFDFSPIGAEGYDLAFYRDERPVLLDDGPFVITNNTDPVPFTMADSSTRRISCAQVGNQGIWTIGPIKICYYIDDDGTKHIRKCPSSRGRDRNTSGSDIGAGTPSNNTIAVGNARALREVLADRLVYRPHGIVPIGETDLVAIEIRSAGLKTFEIVDERLISARKSGEDACEDSGGTWVCWGRDCFCFQPLPSDTPASPLTTVPVDP